MDPDLDFGNRDRSDQGSRSPQDIVPTDPLISPAQLCGRLDSVMGYIQTWHLVQQILPMSTEKAFEMHPFCGSLAESPQARTAY